jgi:hypothetical protein
MPAGSTYSTIATTTLGSAASNYTFSSIPSTYTDLILVRSGGVASPDEIALRFNGDTASNYSYTSMSGYNGGMASGRGSNQTQGRGGAAWTTSGNNTIWQVMNYANTTNYKTLLQRFNDAGDPTVGAAVTMWRSNNAINSIQILTVTGQNFTSGTTFTLYGITAA